MTPGQPTTRRILSVVNGDWAFLLNRLPMARAARDAGFEVHVATHVNNGGPAIEAEGFVLHAIPFQRDGLSPLAAISAALAIRKLESRIRPSIVHHSGVQCCVFGSLAALGRDLPTVNAITGLGYIFTSVSFRSRLLKLAMIWLLPRLLNRRQSTILVQNPDDRQALIALGAKPEHITLIPGSGVDTDRLQPLPEPDGPITVCSTRASARWSRPMISCVRKGTISISSSRAILTRLILPPSRAKRSRPGRSVLASPGSAISTTSSRCGVPHISPLSPRIARACPGADGSSRLRPATNAPGCREICIAGQTGLTVPIEDPEALAEAILKLAQSVELRAHYGAAARKLVEDKLSARIIGQSTAALYNRLTRDKGGSS